jgi:sulfide:quinone oxidoreductase
MQAKVTSITPNLSVASQIAADDIGEFAHIGFRALINNRPDDEEPGQLASGTARARAEAAGIDYHYLPFTAATLTDADIAAFGSILAEAEGPVIAHCRSGTRCYLIWAICEVRAGRATPDALIAQAAERGFDIAALRQFVAG